MQRQPNGYAREKLYLAVSYSATAPGDARRRLEGVWSHIHVLREEHLPPAAWRKVSAVLEKLYAANDVTESYRKLGRGAVAANVDRMKNATAARLLKHVWEAFEIVSHAV